MHGIPGIWDDGYDVPDEWLDAFHSMLAAIGGWVHYILVLT